MALVAKLRRQAASNPHFKTPLMERLADVQTAFDIFMDRVQRQTGAKFHGGKIPDACDFKVYALVARMQHTFVVKKIFSHRDDKSFQHWFERMDVLCRGRRML